MAAHERDLVLRGKGDVGEGRASSKTSATDRATGASYQCGAAAPSSRWRSSVSELTSGQHPTDLRSVQMPAPLATRKNGGTSRTVTWYRIRFRMKPRTRLSIHEKFLALSQTRHAKTRTGTLMDPEEVFFCTCCYISCGCSRPLLDWFHTGCAHVTLSAFLARISTADRYCKNFQTEVVR